MGEDVEFVTLLNPNSGTVVVDQGQTEQILMNLVVNAIDAINGGGKIVVATNNVSVDEAMAAKHPNAEPGEYVMLSVTDYGLGMDEEFLSHIFDPFYTTKEEGKGIGLGMATSYGIVQQNHGLISVRSELGEGTFVEICPPMVHDLPDMTPTASHIAPIRRGTETVLLVEDEYQVKNLAAQALREQGYIVLEASNRIEALRVAEESPHTEIQLLLTDVVMPLMGGKELSKQLGT